MSVGQPQTARCLGVAARADRAEAGLAQIDGLLVWIECSSPLVEVTSRQVRLGQVKSSQVEGEASARVWWRTSPHVFVLCSE